MLKKITFGIIGLTISFAIIISLIVITNGNEIKNFVKDYPYEVKSTFAIIISIVGAVAAVALIMFASLIGLIIYTIFREKKLKKSIAEKIPKEKELDVNVIYFSNLAELLEKKLKYSATYDGEEITLKISLPEEVTLKTNDLTWFADNFKY